MDVFSKMINSLDLEQKKINNNIDEKKEELSLLEDKLKLLVLLDRQLDEDIINFDVDALRGIIDDLNIKIISDFDLSTINGIKKLIPFLFDPNILNVGLKKQKLSFIKNLKIKLAKIRNEIENKINNINSSLSLDYDTNSKFDYYRLRISEEFCLEMSVEELNLLFDFLENTGIDKKIILDFIYNINIKRLSIEEKLNKINDDELLDSDNILQIIDDNAIEIFGKLSLSKSNNNIDLSFLSEEEKKLIFQIDTMILEHDNNSSSDNLNSFIKDFFTGIDLEERKEHYLCEDGLDWSMISADYHINLFPNIINNKKEVFDIIRYIINENKRINNLKDKYNENLSDAKEMSIYLKSICSDAKGSILYNNYYNLIYNLIYELDKIIEENNLNYFNMKSNNSRLLKLLEDGKNLVNKLEEINISIVEENNNDSLYDLNSVKTICLLLKDNEGNYVPYREIDKEEDSVKGNAMKCELEKVIYKISSMGMYDNRRRFKTLHVTDKKPNGKDIFLGDAFGFVIDRIRSTNDGRTCYIPIPVCQENRKKISSMYGANVFYNNYNSIILVVSTIFCSAGHNEYNSFQPLISENDKYIKYVIELFNDPNSKESELQSIIEESANVLSRYSSENKFGGRLV